MSKQFKPSEPPPPTASDAIPPVPRELLDELHDATKHFGDAKEKRERAVDAATYETGSRDEAVEEVREAEKHVEHVTEKSDTILNRQPLTESDARRAAG